MLLSVHRILTILDFAKLLKYTLNVISMGWISYSHNKKIWRVKCISSSTRSISASFTRACHFLEIDDLHFHDLRHDGVSRLFEMGWDIPKVASVSGHRDWNSMRRYTHLKGNGDPYENWPWLETIVTGPIIEARKRIKKRGVD